MGLGDDRWEWHETDAGPVSMRKMTPGRSTPLPTVIVRDGLVITTDVGPTATPLSVMKAVIAENEPKAEVGVQMAPERLAWVRDHVTAALVDAPPQVAGSEWSTIPSVPTSMVAALLADRDHHAQRADDADRGRHDAINRKVVEEGRRMLAERERDKTQAELARLSGRLGDELKAVEAKIRELTGQPGKHYQLEDAREIRDVLLRIAVLEPVP